MYSILDENEFYFSARTMTKVSMLILDRSFLADPETNVQNLKESIHFGMELIKEDGVPI